MVLVRGRFTRAMAASAVVATLALTGCGGDAEPSKTSSSAPSATASAEATGKPMSFSAPSIDVSGPLTPTVAKDGVVNPPTGTLAWVKGYERVVPGEMGTAVIAGHVVNGKKPDIFADLEEMKVGDEMTVVDADGKKHTYAVTKTRVATKEDVSHDPVVWGSNDSVRRLALITCDDEDGYRSDGHRIANFVVIAEAV